MSPSRLARAWAVVLAAACSAGPSWATAPYGAGQYDTSEYMMGKIAVRIIFPQCSGVSECNETWTNTMRTNVINQITSAMSWWAARDSRANLSFDIASETINIGLEPIKHPVSTNDATCGSATVTCEEVWVKALMAAKNYSDSDYFARVAHYNRDARDSSGADWSLTIFVVNSLVDSDGMFPDGYFAYTYVGGPFMVMTYDNQTYGISNMAAVTAHEFGHAFYALDEYATNGLVNASSRSGYLNVVNGNYNGSGALSNVSCIMRGDVGPYNSPAICEYTKQMIGWRYTTDSTASDILPKPGTQLTAYSPDPTTNTTPTYSGQASIATYPNSNPYTYSALSHTAGAISLLHVSGVEYRVDSGGWSSCTASDGAFDGMQEDYSCTTSALANGSHVVETRAVDNWSRPDASPASDSLTVSATGLSGSVIIGSGYPYTASTSVSLLLSAAGGIGAMQMRFSNDNSSWSGWESYATSKVWSLTSGEGLKTVYVQFKDSINNMGAVSGTITLDTTGPTGSVSIAGGASYTQSSSVILTLSASDAGSGVAQMRFSGDGSNWTAWENYATAKGWNFDSGDGLKTVYVQYKDTLGNATQFSDTITVDSQGPTGSISIAGGAAYAQSTTVTLTLSASDAGSGVSQMRFSNDGSNWSAWETYATSKAGWTLASGDGVKTVTVEFKDGGGTTASFFDTIILDTLAPTGGLSVAAGAAYTPTTSVTLTVTASDAGSGLYQMRFSNDGSNWSTWEAYATSKAWILSSGDGAKTVYVQVKDNVGNVSASASDSIVLDTVGPSGSVVVDGGATYARTTSVALALSASDAGAGVSQMRISNDNSNWSTWESYAASKAWLLSSGDGAKTVYVQFKDAAGNVSAAVISDAITLDATPPSAGVSVAAGAAYTRTASVSLTLSASDPGSGLAQMRLSNDGASWSDWESFATPKAWTLSSGEGAKTVTLEVRDNAGNSATASDGIVYDATPPSFSFDTPKTGVTLGGTLFPVRALSSDTDIASAQFQYKKKTDASWTDLGGVLAASPWVTWWNLATLTQGTEYQVRLSASDSAGNSNAGSEPMVEFLFSDAAPTAEYKSAAAGAAVTLDVPNGATASIPNTPPLTNCVGGLDISGIRDMYPTVYSAVQSADSRASRMGQVQLPGADPAMQLLILDNSGAAITQNLAAYATVSIPYPDLDSDGIVDGTQLPVSMLRIYRLNEASGSWELVADGGTNGPDNPLVSKTVKAQVRHFSVYSAMGLPLASQDLGQVVLYPNPFTPGKAVGGIMKVIHLTPSARMKIFSLSGQLVREFSASDLHTLPYGPSFGLSWDGTNSGGRRVASGTYIYLITDDDGNKASGKISVIR